jgi:hypothetical protein
MVERWTSEEIEMSGTTTSHASGAGLRRPALLFAGLALLLLAWLAGPLGQSPADAAFGDGSQIHKFNAYPTDTQAGGHPDLWIEFNIDNRYNPQLKDPEDPTKLLPCACNDAKDIVINLPAGFTGNPHSTPQCNAKQFAFSECPVDSQIGVTAPQGCIGSDLCVQGKTPVFNLIPPPGHAGLTGFRALLLDAPVYTFLTARTGSDYGLRASVLGTERVFPVPYFIQVLWGVPADPVNDAERYPEGPTNPGTTPGEPSNSPLIPFLSNPTTCGEPLSSTLDVLAYDGGKTHAEAPWPSTTGCSQLAFNPTLAANPTTTRADSPSGMDVELTVPQTQSPKTPSPSEIRATSMTLPPGFTINPNAADGKTSCSDAVAKFGTEDEAECPEFAKVGTLEIHSAVLPGVLPGAVYLGEPQPGNRYRVFLTADGFGLHVKLPGVVLPDPKTGQVVIAFNNLPQSPFERFSLHLFGSERGILATPAQCGTYPVKTTFTPWDSALSTQDSTQFFTIDQGPNGTPCPGPERPFAPTFEASSDGNTAGAHSPFTVEIQRPDGDQTLDGLTVSTPPGFSGVLKGIPYCPESAIGQLNNVLYAGLAELTSSACPAASLLGTAVAGAGAGSRPAYFPGKVYLAGPYKGAPLSLVVVIPAVSGPYDLGNVVIRAAIKVDPVTARVTTVSDPVPQIIEGIPPRTRSIQVRLDRPDFALNPTNCDPLSVDAVMTGSEGGRISRSSHYQVANCGILPFAPKLSLKLSGGLARRGHPAINAVFQAKPGEANSRFVSVLMPKGELLDNAHIGAVCTKVNFAADTCPASSQLGTAEAASPLLDEPLKGSVYLRSSTNELPDIAIALKGQVSFDLVGRVDSVNARLRTTFETVPDVPVSKFSLSLYGGKRGLLVNSESLCGRRSFAVVQTIGQNGAVVDSKSKLQTACGSKARHKRHSKKAGR